MLDGRWLYGAAGRSSVKWKVLIMRQNIKEE
jgi:hypothetical protein